MTERLNATWVRGVMATGLAIAAGLGSVPPVAAQSLGGDVSGCVLRSGTVVKLGRFGSVADAIAAARGANLGASDHATATLALPGQPVERTIVIDAGGSAHGLSSPVCGIGGARGRETGPKPRDPEKGSHDGD